MVGMVWWRLIVNIVKMWLLAGEGGMLRNPIRGREGFSTFSYPTPDAPFGDADITRGTDHPETLTAKTCLDPS